MRRSPRPAVLALGLMSCAPAPGESPAAHQARAPAELEEAWLTARDTVDNVDSPAVWGAPDGRYWLVSTAKTTDVLLVHDAASGAPVRRVGGPGRAPGRFERPNGIAIVDDLALVVERDNHRVQVLRLPAFTPLGTFGDSLLRLPYGLAVVGDGAGGYRVWVTDNYEMPDESVPPDSLLGGRVREFKVAVAGDRIAAEPVRAFGATRGPGVLRVVESIAVDPTFDRLLIADESEGASLLKVYSLDGRFTGATVDGGLFPHQAEGIALYACGDSAGYWIATDQDRAVNTFHVLDRRTLAHLGSFRGRTTRNTDGIALARDAFGAFREGAFFAVHDDGNLAAFSWSAIGTALGLRRDCGASGRS